MKFHKEKIDKLITLEKENNLVNHILTSLFNKGKTIAKKNTNEYIIWTSNYWVGFFYPIFKINFDKDGEITNIKSELSLNGKLWRVILSSLLILFFVFFLIIPIIENFKNFDFSMLIILGVFSLLAFGFIWVFKKFYENETKNLLNELKILVGLDSKETIEEKENKKSEWTLKRILLRVFIYPFALFIIFISCYGIYKGTFFRGFFGVLIAVAFLYTDIKIIWKKRKTKAKNIQN
ncbi:hypothetical protein [Polaribacter sp. SA4-12]|uniref:hypothetical protein n=1 Tax=Polaribacter sp. SA4-12 TaxID=1312072 RepID=UPI0012F94391|nr:hypothetical protein [Polaribacter sp. SA4-12]